MEEESVTLYMAAHGVEFFGNSSYKPDNNVFVMSFIGVPNSSSDFGICSDNRPLDFHVLEYIKNYYENSGGTQYKNIFSQELKDKLKQIYEEELEVPEGTYLFSTIKPVANRYFFFKPNEHENCNKCIENNEKLKGIYCSKNRNPECPEYGLTIVESSNPSDNGYTLVTAKKLIDKNVSKLLKSLDTTDEDKEKLIREQSNMNINKNALEHWRKRAYKYDTVNKLKYKGKLMTHNELIDFIIDNIIKKKVVLLNEVIYLFKSMGFKRIYILDPTCRVFDEDISRPNIFTKKRMNEEQATYNPMLYQTNSPQQLLINENPLLNEDTPLLYEKDFETNEDNNVCSKLGSCVKKCVDNICEWVPIFKTKISGGKTKKTKKTKKIKQIKFPIRYLPNKLSKKDKKAQIKMLIKSKKLYKKNEYYTRKKLASYKNKTSKHIIHARKIYNVKEIIPNKELSLKTGCSIDALNKIVKKGQGAYYSSGSRPNQTSQSWGLARLASSITSGKAAAVDYDILKKGCNHKKTAFILANKAKQKYKYGRSKTKKVKI